MHSEKISPRDWDSAVFGLPCFEILDSSEEVLAGVRTRPGHFAVKVDPLASTEALFRNGFHYCDTLIEPYCIADRFRGRDDPLVSMTTTGAVDDFMAMSRGAFVHGRFHRDFSLSRDAADQRYENWLRQLDATGGLFRIWYAQRPAAFIGIDGSKLVLHAVEQGLRGRGLARSLWTPVIRQLFASGAAEVSSSISAANLAVLNLYISMGFRMRNVVDVYHRGSR